MQKRVILAFWVLVLLSGLVAIDSYKFSPTGMFVKSTSDALASLDTVKNDYNANLQYVPSFVKTLIGSERINATITRNDGSKVQISAIAKDGAIQQIGNDTLDSYTMDVQVSEATIDGIIASKDQTTAVRSALDSGAISYQARTFGTSIKTGIGGFFLKIMGWFGL